MPEDRTRHDVLTRITGNPELARAVPLLAPEILHAVITNCGLQDCGELLALATPEQLSAVFDLDLWRVHGAGADERFDSGRFCEWLEVLVDAGPALAAARLAQMDVALLVAGLAPSVRVFDPVVFAPEAEPSGADVVSDSGRERGIHAEIGGYLIVEGRPDAWGTIVEVLRALDEHQPDTFHRVMRGCRGLSDSGRESDGLDDLLPDGEQHRFELSLGREQRRDRLGFLPPEQARAFLNSARHVLSGAEQPAEHPAFAAYRRSVAAIGRTQVPTAAEPGGAQANDPPAEAPPAVAGVVEALRSAGVLAAAPRALLPGPPDEPSSANTALNEYLRASSGCAETAWMARRQELAFLANALVAGCSVQERPFARREAVDAVAATCNLGLSCWPPRWPDSATCDLVSIFQVGWAVLYRDVSMLAAERLVDTLDNLRSSDLELQLGLHVLRQELHKQRLAGTPWRARDRLDVLAALDLPAWAALTALFGECPVMLANVSRAGDRRPLSVNPSEFQFIADARGIAAVREFLLSLPEQLTS